ncbi:TadE family protein [Castellaniella sp. MT123]|uniref:TadE family protein n=1 Tax=Castellaniella sp. MT123 TaxID=3140381 RepID=UPI0031F433EE
MTGYPEIRSMPPGGCLPEPCPATGQDGQALAEALVVLGVLGSLWVGIAWLGRVQDAGLQLSNASRRAAFAYAYQEMALPDLSAQVSGHMQGSGHVWRSRRGDPLLPAGAVLNLDASAKRPASEPGDPVPDAASLRQELKLGEDAVWLARVGARTQGQAQTQSRLSDFDRLAVSLQRHTAILRGSGAASGDMAVQATLGESHRAWSGLAGASHEAGQRIDQRLQGVDEAWGRSRPSWDWLTPWAGRVPARHLNPWRSP